MYRTLFLSISTFLLAFLFNNPIFNEKPTLEYYESMALKENRKGKEYIIDFTGRKECNKSEIIYLGTITTNKGRTYKILTSFYVFRTASSCRGSSAIKFYNLKNQFLGQYSVGMNDELPDAIIGTKLIYTKAQTDCPKRKSHSIDLSKGLPKSFFLPCSKVGGDIIGFSS